MINAASSADNSVVLMHVHPNERFCRSSQRALRKHLPPKTEILEAPWAADSMEGDLALHRFVPLGENLKVDPNRVFTDGFLSSGSLPGREPVNPFLSEVLRGQARGLLTRIGSRVLITKHFDAPPDHNLKQLNQNRSRELESVRPGFPDTQCYFYLEARDEDELRTTYPGFDHRDNRGTTFVDHVTGMWQRVIDRMPAQIPVASVHRLKGSMDATLDESHLQVPLPGMVVNDIAAGSPDGSVESYTVHGSYSGLPGESAVRSQFSMCFEYPLCPVKTEVGLSSMLAQEFLAPLLNMVSLASRGIPQRYCSNSAKR
jgi:hypothetical protein